VKLSYAKAKLKLQGHACEIGAERAEVERRYRVDESLERAVLDAVPVALRAHAAREPHRYRMQQAWSMRHVIRHSMPQGIYTAQASDSAIRRGFMRHRTSGHSMAWHGEAVLRQTRPQTIPAAMSGECIAACGMAWHGMPTVADLGGADRTAEADVL
jgi:hypothetical protein